MNEVDAELALGKKLQEARQKAGLTQQALCQKADISYSTLAKIERGAIKAPSVFTIMNIAEVLNVSLDELMGRQIAPTLPPVKPKKVSKNGIRFVYFDVNGCLVRFFHRALTKLSEKHGASEESVESAFWHWNDAVCRGDITMDEFNNHLANALGTDNVDWTEYYLDEVDPIEEMHDFLKWAGEHYHVGLLTNIMPGSLDAMMERGLLPEVHYSALIDSSEVGAIKPEEEIYQIAAEKTNCNPNEILLVDDSRSNVMAAEKLGWKVLWFDDFHPSE
ncbi:HAD-IA family hydrolase, partial [Candidatus Saccharibacteria bacterium]|nr:HAD-IA family hydrolase [Candidatus Saccharibacteria bacterium]